MRWILLCIFVVLGACSEQAPPERSADGPRIVSLSPAASVMLIDAGLEDRIVGRHGWDAVLDQALPVAGDQTGLDYERLIGLDPTHVVIEWGARALPERLSSLSASRGFEVVPVETLTLADIAASAAQIRETFGAPGAVQLETLAERHEPMPAWGTVLLIVATTPSVDCLGPGSAHHELLTLGGFEPAIAEGSPWVTLSLEDVIRLDPGCIVLVQPGGSPDGAAGTAADRLGPLAETELAAVRLGRVVVIDDPTALIPSVNLAAVAETLRDRLRALGPLPSPRDD